MSALLSHTVANISSLLSANKENSFMIKLAANMAMKEYITDIIRAIEKIADKGLPSVDSRKLLRHLMTTQS